MCGRADNDQWQGLEINWQLKNIDAPTKKFFLVPGSAKSYSLMVLHPKSKAYSYSYHFTCIPGDIVGAKHNDAVTYKFPFKEGFQTKVSQGYNGGYSHRGVMAIDFVANEGTPVCAARAGIVVETESNNKGGCASPKCMKMANFVKVLHDDGTEALYSHLKHKGVIVEIGQFVQVGQVLAYSGNTGWTTNPHLHFEVLVPDYKGGKSVQTHFMSNGKRKLLTKGDEVK